MQFLGYALSAFGPNYITWIFLERMFRRKNIPTPVMAILPGILSIFITLQTQYAYQVYLNSLATLISIYLLACLLLSGGLDAPIICIRSISGLWCNK